MSSVRCSLCPSCWKPSYVSVHQRVRLQLDRSLSSVLIDSRLVVDLRMSAFHGNFFVRSTDLLAMPSVPQDQSYAIEIQIEDNLTAPFVVLQTAVLHTTCYGQLLSPFHFRIIANSMSASVRLQVNAAFVSSPLRCRQQATSRRCSRPRIRSLLPHC